jgi:ABC-2 type transport system ATP-binding protein
MSGTGAETMTNLTPAAETYSSTSAVVAGGDRGHETVIQVNHLRKRYGKVVAIEDVSFDVRRSEIFGIAGPNGAGKSSTVEIIQGLRAADGGDIRVLGIDPHRDTQALRRRIGSQLQQSALPDRMKVWEALSFFASFTPGQSNWSTLVDQWGLRGKENTAFADLSGGQQQRLFIALALINNPEIIFLDELTQGLDPAARRIVWDLIRDARDQGATIVLVTHFMDEAETLCDRLAIIDHGRVIAIDTPQGLIADHGGSQVLTFSSVEPDLSWLEVLDVVQSVERVGERVTVTGDGALVPLASAALVQHGIVPHDLRVHQRSLEETILRLTGRNNSNGIQQS